MAGDAMAVAAAPAAETFKKSRRFIVSPWVGMFPGISSSDSTGGTLHRAGDALAGAL
jgi:hypothetical protein